MTLILTIMILVSLKLVYLSTNALLIRKIKDQAKPHQIRSDLIKPNIGFGEEKFDPYQLLHLVFIYLFIYYYCIFLTMSVRSHTPS